jgi:hypothetical protein
MSRPRRRRLRSVTWCLALALAATACKKDGESTSPASAEKGDGLQLRYPEKGFRLGTEIQVALEVSGMATGSLKLAARGTLEATPHGQKQLRVMGRVDEVASFEASGDMAPETKEGETPPDLKVEMKGAESFVVTDLRGDADEAATKALPQNVEKEKKEEAEGDEANQRRSMAQAFGGSVITLPGLPEIGLEVGKETKMPTKEEERPLGARKLPVEVDTVYHLEKIDESSGSRVATIKFKSESSGADEMENPQGGSMFVAYEEETEGTLLFDLDANLPVSLRLEQATAISAGDNAFEQYLELSATYAKP